MKYFIYTLLGMIILLPGAQQGQPGGLTNTAALNEQTLADQIASFVRQQMATQHLPGLGLAITHGDQIIMVQGYGDGITPQSQFLIASLRKSFTALAVMQLVEAGKIQLDVPIQSYLPEFALSDAAAAKITVRHLLNQTSGLSDRGFPESTLPQPDSLEARVRSLQTAHIVGEPGTQYHYFNPNYGVLARLVEVVSSQPFASYMHSRVFEPLGMTHTFTTTTSDKALRTATMLAPGHLQLYGVPVPIREMSGFLAGSGGMVSTPEDLAHFLVAQNSGGVYSGSRIISQSLALMHTPATGINSTYAMGWLSAEHNGVRTIEHNGIVSVYYADMVLLPDSGHGIVLLYNLNGLPATLISFPQIKNGLIDLLDGKTPSTGRITTTTYGAIAALVTVLGMLFALGSLLRLPRWSRQTKDKSVLRLMPGVAFGYLPGVLLVLVPWLVAYSDRVYSLEQLIRFAPDIYIWLGITGLLGAINSTLCLLRLVTRRRPRSGQGD